MNTAVEHMERCFAYLQKDENDSHATSVPVMIAISHYIEITNTKFIFFYDEEREGDLEKVLMVRRLLLYRIA